MYLFQMLDISEMPPTGKEAKRRKKLEGDEKFYVRKM